MAININIEKVEATAQRIASFNSQIRNEFAAVKNAVATLNKYWDGTASDNAMRAFNNIQESYCDYRYSVINDLVAFLLTQVGTEYHSTEMKIKSAADAFK